MSKPVICICENKDADQLRGNHREADQRLCFRYTASTIPVLPEPDFQASSHLLWLYSLVCVGPGRKPRRPVFSQRGSIHTISKFSQFVSLTLSNTRRQVSRARALVLSLSSLAIISLSQCHTESFHWKNGNRSYTSKTASHRQTISTP